MLGFQDAEEMEGGLLGELYRRPHRAGSRRLALSVIVGLVLAIVGLTALQSMEPQWSDSVRNTIVAHQTSTQTSEVQLSILTSLDASHDAKDRSDSRDHSDGNDKDADEEPDGDCVEEFGQCTGKRDGKSFIACCPDYFWCARFGDWWGICLPSKVYRFPEHPEQQRPWRNEHGHDEHNERGSHTSGRVSIEG